ncbi:hypothetical protein KIN20_035279 [Parelaphostrongylus tenuis]|uniref:Uncharacterized protein n=1 Tax=Parelaphostrongylus tenuis TaxID=148309 RepID=A0AAD5RBK9_PARTN|nr:hypothetical protein KIN20_035279 [Parelaphostrongylus tenuis]
MDKKGKERRHRFDRDFNSTSSMTPVTGMKVDIMFHPMNAATSSSASQSLMI